MARSKHHDVELFMALYSRLRDWTDDEPHHVLDMARDDDVFKRLCLELCALADSFLQAERTSRTLFAKTVSQGFIKVWRDWRRRYSSSVSVVWLVDAGIELGDGVDPVELYPEIDFDCASEQAAEEAESVSAVFTYTGQNLARSDQVLTEAVRANLEAGISVWRELTSEMGFDLTGVLRRRNLVPFVLLPRHVSDHYGDTDARSLFEYLEQAHAAFVYGAPLAALALMRSLLELILRNHYRAVGVDLNEQINNAAGLSRSQKAGLHTLRSLANAVLHHDSKRQLPPSLEQHMVKQLYLLRDVIEAAP